jgi:hypothetical protein
MHKEAAADKDKNRDGVLYIRKYVSLEIVIAIFSFLL